MQIGHDEPLQFVADLRFGRCFEHGQFIHATYRSEQGRQRFGGRNVRTRLKKTDRYPRELRDLPTA